MLEAVLNSFLLVAAAEMGDKTQLLAFVLASRFQKPFAVLAGILVATVANHWMAAAFGNWVAAQMSAEVLKWILGLTFFAFAIWILIPDKDEGLNEDRRFGAFLTTLVAFFIAEMGDKTQLSTVALAAKYEDILLVTFGTTLGMMFSDGLAVAFGKSLTDKISMRWVHIISAILFAGFGVVVIVS